MLTVIPVGLVGATVAVALRGLENDVYFQVGLLTTMGLSAKNAILIIEFAGEGRAGGASRRSTPRWKRRGCGCGRSS